MVGGITINGLKVGGDESIAEQYANITSEIFRFMKRSVHSPNHQEQACAQQ